MIFKTRISSWFVCLGLTRPTFRLLACCWLSCCIVGLSVTTAQAQSKTVMVVVGAEGAPEYGIQFRLWAEKWRVAIESASSTESSKGKESDEHSPEVILTTRIECLTIGLDAVDGSADLDLIEAELNRVAQAGCQEFWLVMIGHGTYDQRTAKFNLRGPDLSAENLKAWLAPIDGRVVVINCTSASSPFINQLTGERRVIVTATKSGAEQNFARFGGFLADCLGDTTIDLDKDQQTSLLEAFLAASARTQEFYQQETRLATESALLDDNGDGLGTPAEWFSGTRAVQQPIQGIADGLAANQIFLRKGSWEARLSAEQLEQRNRLELQLEQLRLKKSTLPEDSYFEQIEKIMLELATLYSAI